MHAPSRLLAAAKDIDRCHRQGTHIVSTPPWSVRGGILEQPRGQAGTSKTGRSRSQSIMCGYVWVMRMASARGLGHARRMQQCRCHHTSPLITLQKCRACSARALLLPALFQCISPGHLAHPLSHSQTKSMGHTGKTGPREHTCCYPAASEGCASACCMGVLQSS